MIRTNADQLATFDRILYGDYIFTGDKKHKRDPMFSPHSRVRFLLGIVRHPGEALLRLREVFRIARAPSVQRSIATEAPPEVHLVRVTDAPELRETVVGIYRRNPSPFVSGPTSLEELAAKTDAGVRFYLVKNGAGDAVGVRAFDPRTGTLQNTITDFDHRGAGYQLHAGKLLRDQLAAEGFTEFRSTILRTNTRIRRAMEASGWEMTDDPDNPDLIRCVLRPRQK